MKRTLALCSLLALSACGVGGGGSDAGADAAVVWPEGTLSLGGEAADGGFTTLPSDVDATPGSQGGYHVPIMYQVADQTLSAVVFEHRVTRARDGVLVSKGSRTLDVTPTAPGEPWRTERGVIIFLCPTPVGVNIVGEMLDFQVTAKRDGQTLGTAKASTTFHCPAGDTFCESICSG